MGYGVGADRIPVHHYPEDLRRIVAEDESWLGHVLREPDSQDGIYVIRLEDKPGTGSAAGSSVGSILTVVARSREILATLEERRRNGATLAALDDHIRALVAADEHDLAAWTAALSSAQEWEAANGYPRAALHTSHQLALITNFGGDLRRLRKYYHETLRTLKKMHNREGMALCLRSVGELALVSGNPPEAAQMWQLSGRLFEALGLPEAEQLKFWLDIHDLQK